MHPHDSNHQLKCNERYHTFCKTGPEETHTDHCVPPNALRNVLVDIGKFSPEFSIQMGFEWKILPRNFQKRMNIRHTCPLTRRRVFVK